MEEIIIDTVAAYAIEVGDRVQYMDPDSGEYIIDNVKDIDDFGETVEILFEDRDESIAYACDQRFDLYGYEMVEV